MKERVSDHRDLKVTPGNLMSEASFVLRFIWMHPANRGRRLSKIAEATAYQISSRLFGKQTVARLGERSRIIVPRGVPSASRALYANPPDWPEMIVWREHLQPGDLFVDVGANIGIYAIFAAEIGAEVIAVEPGPPAVEMLRRNIALNAYDIDVFEGAAADRPGTMPITTGLDMGNHLIVGERTGRDVTVVEVTTVDELIGDRTLAGLKVDVEGAERLVVEGARSALSERRIRMLQVEWTEGSQDVLGESRSPVARLLTQHGYRLFRPDMSGKLRDAGDDPPYGEDVFALPG